MIQNKIHQFGQYQINSLIEKGGYGNVYKAIHSSTLKSYAIKLSDSKQELHKEYEFLLNLQSFTDFPKVYDYQEHPTKDALIMELLGRNLSYRSDETPFTFKCVCAIGIKLIDSIEKMHESGILHRDLKPGNFLVSLDKKNVKIVDFGIATCFKSGRHHKEFKTHKMCKGTPSFASINNHLGFTQSRRDDIECWYYSLLYLLTGGLPWKNGGKFKGFTKWKYILSQKIMFMKSEWFSSLPAEFKVLIQYIRKLTYEQRPNYLYLKTLLSRYVHLNHLYSYFDWYDIKEDTNLVNSQQIVEGATTVTKLKREKKKTTNFSNARFNTIKKKKTRRSFEAMLKKCLCQEISEKSKYQSVRIKKNSDSKSKKRHRNKERTDFLQLPTCDEIFMIKNKKHGHQTEIRSVKSEHNLDCAQLESSNSLLILGNQQSFEKDLLSIEIDSEKEDNRSQGETPKSNLPEFKDKVSALSIKKKFIEINEKGHKVDCLIF